MRCDFRLDYRNNGQVRTLASWHEIYEGQFYPVDLDLGSLAGETVKFILVVSANGSQNNDNAIWLHPHIIRQGSAPHQPILQLDPDTNLNGPPDRDQHRALPTPRKPPPARPRPGAL